jgi:hypothetical protein
MPIQNIRDRVYLPEAEGCLPIHRMAEKLSSFMRGMFSFTRVLEAPNTLPLEEQELPEVMHQRLVERWLGDFATDVCWAQRELQAGHCRIEIAAELLKEI